jgi:hypothetical protein
MIAERLRKTLSEIAGTQVRIRHRDILQATSP